MSLSLWLENGWIKTHKASSREIAELLAIADRALKDSQIKGLSADGKLSMAHNTALQSAAAALAAAGYRAERRAYHYYVIQSLAFTLELEDTIVERLNKLRAKRNISDYERPGGVYAKDAEEMLDLAKAIRQQVEEWICKNHPGLALEL